MCAPLLVFSSYNGSVPTSSAVELEMPGNVQVAKTVENYCL